MGNCMAQDDKAASAEPSGAKKKKGGKRVKILLLGAGEAGKSTIAKQMKILHMKGFGEDEVQLYKKQVHRNVLDNVRLVIGNAPRLGIQLDDQEAAARVMDEHFMPDLVLTPEAAGPIRKLWQDDKGFREAYARGSEYHLTESTGYFLDSLERLAMPDYRPTQDDILRSRRLTVGAEEIEFEIDGYLFHVIDVGGQKGEREKWIDYFQNNDAVVFFASMSEYDQRLLEDNETKRMTESLKLFSDICNHQWFASAAIILFLNKCDLFREKIQRVPLTVAFPEYTGKNEYEPAAEYVKNKFLERVQSKRRTVYSYITCATNTENFRTIFGYVKDIVVGQAMASIGM